MKNNTLNTFFIVSLFFLLSCNTSNKSATKNATISEENYPETILPKDLSKLWLADGDLKKDTVLIICQGGPHPSLSFAEKRKSNYRYIRGYNNYLKIHLHQSNTFNPKMFKFKDQFSLEMAEKETAMSSEILFKAIKYFKDKNKYVIVTGHSYGAFIVSNYLVDYPLLADNYIVIAGRIDADEKNVHHNLLGLNGHFEGSIFIPDNKDEINQRSEEERKIYQVKQFLKAAIGKPRYSKKLANKDLSKIVHIYSLTDDRVGPLSQKEIDFLESKNATVFSTKHPHGSSIWALADLIEEGKVKL